MTTLAVLACPCGREVAEPNAAGLRGLLCPAHVAGAILGPPASDECAAPSCSSPIAAGRGPGVVPLAAVLCLEHVLAILHADRCLAPACRESVAVPGSPGLLSMLCAAHLASTVPTAPGVASATAVGPDLADVRGRCWGEGMTCPSPAVTRTPHGGWCAEHAPIRPASVSAHAVTPDADVRDAEDPLRVAALLEVVRSLGGQPVRTEPTYGIPVGWGCTWKRPKTPKPGEEPPAPHAHDPGRPVAWAATDGLPEVEVMAGRVYAATPSRAFTVEPDDERVPSGARTMARAAGVAGWSSRLRCVEDPPSLVLRAWRGPLLVVASWEAGRFASGWVMRGRGQPERVGARELGALVEAAL